MLLVMICCLAVCRAADPVKVSYKSGATTLSNGLLTVEIAKDGSVSAITTADGKKVINPSSTATTNEKGYLSYVVIEDGVRRTGELKSTKAVRPVKESSDMVEVVYYNEDRDLKWYVGYIMRRGVKGIYVYASLNSTSATPAGVEEGRFVWRLSPSLFNYCYVNDWQQASLPTVSQMKNYVEEVQDATYRLDDGTIYTKYDWATYMRDDYLHGLMGSNIGVWSITPSMEWLNGGPDKQDLTVHTTDTSPLILQMFQSQHFGTATSYFKKGKQKLFGPYLLYVNGDFTQAQMIEDAKRQMAEEVAAWPYEWFDNDLFPRERAIVSGTISLNSAFHTTKMRVVLSKPGTNPMSQGAGYQYWTETDASGNFSISNVRPGNYAVMAYALNGEATGWYESHDYNIEAGSNQLGTLVWDAPRYEGGTIFCLGTADHSTAGFCMSDRARQYGLWNEVPAELGFTIGSSNPATDWYYAQTQEGTWTINFNCDRTYTEPLHLTIATAGAARDNIKVEVKFNDNQALQSIAYKNDAGVYRSALLGGKDSTVVIEVPASHLRQGMNNLKLKLWNKGTGLGGVMYDLIKLEAGKAVTTGIKSIRQEGDTTDGGDAPVYDLFGRKQDAGRLSKGIYITKGRKFVVK